jgi:predicted small integral membrane protein
VLTVRLSKLVMVAGLALFALLVAADNVADYGSNEAFVRHVLAMDTTFPQNALRWRAVTDPGLQTAAYWLVIAAEALTGVLFGAAEFLMAVRLRAPRGEFRAAAPWVAAGTAVAFALWFVGFMIVGGEWCLMWQSGAWNGQEAAFRFYLTVLGVSVYVLIDRPWTRGGTARVAGPFVLGPICVIANAVPPRTGQLALRAGEEVVMRVP